MKKRIISLVLTVALLFGAMCTLGITAAAETTAPELNITGANISFYDTIVLKFAVPETTENVKLLVWTAPEAEYTLATADDEITEYNTVDREGYFVFNYTKFAAKQMADVIYARAYANIDGVDTYGDVVKYSILQYAKNRIAANGADKALLEAMLAYGAEAQTFFNYNPDRLATANWVEVAVTAGTVDGFESGLYLAGDRVTLSAPAIDAEGKEFAYWIDSAENQIADTATYEIEVGAQSEVYTPVYVAVTLPPVVTTAPVAPDVPAEPEMPELPEWPAASEGLELTYDEEEGIAFVDGIGECTDDVIVIPAEYEGFPVVEISASAFASAAITAVYFPNTLETIANKAFQKCNDLTDVYYNGTPAEWEENVSVGRYNDPINDATMHFTPFLVTFVDYNGRVLKYEYVDFGESATAPADPTRANYVFTGWDVDFSAVESALTVVAQYTYDTDAFAIVINDAIAVDGVATLKLSVLNNPGVTALNVTLSDEAKALLRPPYTNDDNKVIYGAVSVSGFDLDVGLNLFFSANSAVTGDIALAELTFVTEGLEPGVYPITFVIREAVGASANGIDVSTMVAVAGSIIVK